MKKIILSALLVSLTILANAQSKIDSAIKKVDTTITTKSKQLDNTKNKITNIQNNISDFEVLKQSQENEKAILEASIITLKNKTNKTKSEIQRLGNKRQELQQINNRHKAVLDSLILLKTSLNKQIDNAKKQINEADSTIKSRKKLIIEADEHIDIKKKEIDIKTKASKTLDTEIEQKKAQIALQLDSVETVAIIEMRDSVQVRTSSGNVIKVKIEEVRVSVMQGIILEIIVKTEKGIFRNRGTRRTKNGKEVIKDKEGLIIADLLHFGNFTKNRLFIEPNSRLDTLNEDTYSRPYILLKDAVFYTPISSYTSAVYGEFDITLFPTPDKRFYLIKESTSINTYFNVAAFTDIKGISGEPNGVAQFTADAKFMFNTRAIPRTSIVYANYISFQGGLSKFDSEFKGTKLNDDKTLDRRDLLQRANYKVGIKLNLFKGYLPPNPVLLYNTFELNGGYNIIGSQTFKTGFKDVAQSVIDTTFKTVTQNQWYIEPTITFSRQKNFSMSIALPIYFNNIKKSADIKNDQTQRWAVPSISLMYFGKRDAGSKIFFRYNHYINTRDKTQAFSQMQLGYSLNITQAFKK